MLQRGQGNLLPQPGIFFWPVFPHTGTPTQSSIILTLQASHQLPRRHFEHSSTCGYAGPSPGAWEERRGPEDRPTGSLLPLWPCPALPQRDPAAGPSCPLPGLQGAGWRCPKPWLTQPFPSLLKEGPRELVLCKRVQPGHV